MINLDWIHEKIKSSQYYFSGHGDAERQNDNLLISEVEEAILQSIMLENYPDTGRGESCLIAGFSNAGKPIHIVCGIRGENLVIITVYIPTPPKFLNPFERNTL